MLVCDTDMWDRETPAITTMLRGLVLEEVVLRGATRDLHSGLYGGAAINPIRVLSRIVSDLHDENGAVTLPGFYDGVEELPEEIAEQWRALNFDEAQFLGEIGLSVPAGEKGRSALEMIWSRPTCDVNGIVGGYTGVGSKTVIPAQASAKFSFRLVGKQNPEQIAQSFRAFVTARLPADVRAEFISHGASPAIVLPTKSEALRRARRALEAEWGKAGGAFRLRRLDPDRWRVQTRAEHGFVDDRLRSGRRFDPFAQRKIRALVLSQRRALLGAFAGRARRVSAPSIGVGCGAAILREGRLLLVKRLKAPEAGCWSLVGGKVDFLERAEDAVVRETREEVGVEIALGPLLCLVQMIGVDGQHWLSPVYRASIEAGEPSNREPDKIADFGWFALSALPLPLSIAAQEAALALQGR